MAEGKVPVMTARPDTMRKAFANEQGKKFRARGPGGVKAYGSASEFDAVRDRCSAKIRSLLESEI